MTFPCHRLLPLVLVLGGVLRAQVPPPVDPPPWWGKADNDTVSVAWTFNGPFIPPLPNIPPDFLVAPTGWQPPFAGTTFTIPANVQWFPQVSGHQGVIGINGPGTAIVSVLVDNDPRPNWNKVFWFQFDATTTASGQLSAAIRQDLQRNNKRANITEKTVPLGNNWVRTTIDALIIPQPTDETVDFTMSDTGGGIAGIDNLYINSKCVKPWRDEDGDACGMPVGPPFDLSAVNPEILGVAATEDPLTGARRIWLSGPRPSAVTPHLFFQLNAAGQVQNTLSQPVSTVQSVNGMTDLTVVTQGNINLIIGISQQAAAAAPPLLTIFDESTGAFRTPQLQVTGLPAGTAPMTGITWFPHGQRPAGTLILCDAAGNAHEVDLNGVWLRTINNVTGQPGLVLTGAAYDAPTAMFYFFGRGGSADPRNIQVVGTEVSAYDFLPTGVRFYGHMAVPALPGAGNGPGGLSQGIEVVRLNNTPGVRAGEMRIICIARGDSQTTTNQPRSYLYELKGPFRYGHSLLGHIGMRGGVPFRGNQNFGITLEGVPKATFATLFLGFNNQSWFTTPLPFRLTGSLGEETVVNGQLEISVINLPVVNGRAGHTIPLPTHPSWAYAPTFWQWMVLDPTAPFGLTLSQAGKTVLYDSYRDVSLAADSSRFQ